MAPGLLQTIPWTDESSWSFLSANNTTSTSSRREGIETPSRSPEEPLAIVGMAFKLPQEASTEQGLWDMLLQKRNAMTEYPKDRVNIDSFYHPDRSRTDTLNFRGGCFLDELPSRFDAPFFSITKAEAEAMDPQQRLVLETTFHAFESAGMSMEQIAGSKTSVHAGSFSDDYRRIELREPELYPSYACSGIAQAMLSNRVSWFFDLQGASITVDTACSSSLTALDISCQGLRSHEADTGLIVGSNLMLGLELPLTLSNMNFLSPDSKCYSFDHRANGYGRGEGVAVLVVKRLSTAIQSGDTIRAIIQATGSGQDGRTLGITQPSVKAQESLISNTYSKLGLDMGVTRYVEAHGTGTAIGDPIEATAIGNAFKQYRSKDAPMFIGSIKSNLGHLEGCSGLAGVIKTIMMLEKGVLAPNANFEKLNPAIDSERLNLQVVSEVMPWPTRGLRRASVSSFGFGGANVHVVLDDAYNYLRLHGLQGNHCTATAPPTREFLHNPYIPSKLATDGSEPHVRSSTPHRPQKLLLFSAADKDGVDRVVNSYSELPDQIKITSNTPEEAEYLENLAYTLSCRRSMLNWRTFAVVNSLQDLDQMATKVSKPVKCLTTPRLAYAFTGQGAQYAQMAKGLLQFPVFVTSLRRSEMYFDQFGSSWSLLDELAKTSETTRINEPLLSQPLCTAIQIGMVDLLSYLGVSPSVVTGHSSGEIAAAYAIGALDHQGACKVAYLRGVCADELLRIQSPQNNSGSGMMSVGLSADDFAPYLGRISSEFEVTDVVVACFNSPSNITVSGDAHQLDWLKDQLDRDSIFARKLRVNIAYHSPQMQKVAGKYLQLLGHRLSGDSDKDGSVPMVSSVTGDIVSIDELRMPQYWVDNMVLPVRFTDALTSAYKSKPGNSKNKASVRRATFNSILEIGPHSALQAPILSILRQARGESVAYFSVLNRSVSGEVTLLELVGNLICKGYNVSIPMVNDRQGSKRSDRVALPSLPKYPFDHSRQYWHETRSGKHGYRLRKFPRHGLLGTPCPNWNPLEPRWTCYLRTSEQPWIPDHEIKNSVLYPASGMIAMALEAVKQIVPDSSQVSGYILKETAFLRPIVINLDEEHKEVEIVLRPADNVSQKYASAWNFKIFAAEGEVEWQEKCTGTVLAEYNRVFDVVDDGKEARARQIKDKLSLEAAQQCCTSKVDSEVFYQALGRKSFTYGPCFQAASNITSNNQDTACASIKVYQLSSEEKEAPHQNHVVHPTTLDAVIQTCFVAGAKGRLAEVPAMLPSRLDRLWIRAEGASYSTLESINVCMHTQSTNRKFVNEGMAIDPSTGDTILSVEFECISIDPSKSEESDEQANELLCYEMQWKPDLDLMTSADLSEYCNKVRVEHPTDQDFYECTDLLALTYLSDTIQSIPQSRIDTMPSSLQRYLMWASSCLERFRDQGIGHCQASNERWTDISTNMESRNALIEKLKLTDLGNVFMEVALNLSAVLKGDIDAVQFMFQDDKLERFYWATNNQVVCYKPLGRFFDLLTHQNPSLKMMEIGAGTGGSTVQLFDMLEFEGGIPKFASYDYTDISPAFFDKAAETFAKHETFMNFKVLDIERDPADQGFKLGTYDVVFAGSVLHATKNLENTLRNLRKLLKPGGRLIMLEIVEETVRMTFAFGLFPSWWLGEEEGRLLRPWLRVPEWDTIMKRNGFSGIDLEVPDFENAAYHEYSLLVTTATEDHEPETKSTPVCLALNEECAIQKAVGEALQSELVKQGYPCEVKTSKQLDGLEFAKDQYWIALYEVEKPILSSLDQAGFEKMKELLGSSRMTLWVTNGGGNGERDPRYHVIDGLARVVNTELSRSAVVTLALQSDPTVSGSIAKTISKVFVNSLSGADGGNAESEYLEQHNLICSNRVVSTPQQQGQVVSRKRTPRSAQQAFDAGPPLALAIGSTGLLDTIHFVEDHKVSEPMEPGMVEVQIKAGGVNFRDCLTALGQLEADYIGVEYAGVISRVGAEEDNSGNRDSTTNPPLRPGDRVAGWCKGSYQTYTRNPAALVTRVPDGLSLTDAAASLVVFSTAWHALVNVARLSRGESVLIHSAAGGTGQAAIQVARHLGAEVYVTVGSVEKKRFLMETYAIPERRIFASRDLSFASGILRETGGRGVDVVLNSLSGDSLLASWECIATCGRFIEIGNRDIMERSQLPMWPFRKATSFAHVALYVMVEEQQETLMDVGRTVLQLLADKVFFVPQPLKVFGISEVRDVFRLFQSGNNYGRMVVEMRPDDIVETNLTPREKYRFSASRTYVIAGGLGGLGRSIALWMVEKGARNLILLSRSGAKSQSAQDLLRRLAEANVNVWTPPCDICDRDSLQKAIDGCADAVPPIAGCIQAAMVLKDVLFEKMSYEEWTAACMPKVQGTWNLHSVLPSGMDFFTCLSSISCVVGNIGQANYAAGNSYMDAFVRYRNSCGERATTINLGWVEKEGVVAENINLKTAFSRIETMPPISMEELYALLDFACDAERGMETHQVITGVAPPKEYTAGSAGVEMPWLEKTAFKPLRHASMYAAGLRGQSGGTSKRDFTNEFTTAATTEDAAQVVCKCMEDRLSKALGVNGDEIDLSLPLHALGVDSLFAIELKNLLAKQFDADVAVFDITGAVSAEAACKMIANRSNLRT